jgi:hypothetical protein
LWRKKIGLEANGGFEKKKGFGLNGGFDFILE